MHAEPSPRPERGDTDVQRAVLSLALEAQPERLTIPALATEIGESAVTERAVVDLVGVGLLEAGGISVKPTPAAIRFAELELP